MHQYNTTLETYCKTACISAFELVLGLPLDRIKIELQQGAKVIKPTHPYLKYWYAGNIPSLIQRCIIYMPAIKLTNAIIDPEISPYIRPLIVSGVIAPYVAFFEGLKTAQQKQVWALPNSKNITNNKLPSQSMTQIIRYVTYEIKKPELLFASIIPSYLREYCFVAGMVALQPAIYNTLTSTENDKILQIAYTPISCLLASLISQTISQPFDVIKTRVELKPTANLTDIIIELKKQQHVYGWRSVYYAGWLPRVIRGMWTFTCITYI